MSAPDKILELVDRFDRNIDSYKGKYNEAQTRQEFINPFFSELGWDVDNKEGYAEAYKDVVHEDAIKVGSKTKAPDYSFRIGGVRKFFLEAKKPSVNIKDDISPAYQLRRYAWSAKLPLSILTDFEEMAVYDCRYKPSPRDKASQSRIIYYTYKDYEKQWNEIYQVFSKESILKGSFDKFADTSKGKKGTAEVDAEFLKEIEKWRDVLARNLALRNSQLSQRELNFAVQKTIDRIIFLRICEDRGMEQYGRLGALQNGANVYERLLEYFRGADAKYNSGLFHFQHENGREGDRDTLTPCLKIDDKVFKEIVKNLYYPECPYEFSVLSADILGQVYEQFLGKVIYLTAGHQAKVEEKPEVRKAGGVYYTPKYIVDYIVENTVGKLLEKSNPDKAKELKILDPACGSGSFLLGAYQYLLDWHLKQYITDTAKFAKTRPPRIRQTSTGDWRLTIDERKRILLNNIYGVDIDSQAVEVTKLSLLLRVLEDENSESIDNQLSFSFGRERVLPDLQNNIKCGNSLIGPDFYDAKDQPDLFDEDAVLRVNAFGWNAEFAEIMKNGGFDAVIGNPPYVRQETLGEAFKGYAQSHYETFAGTADLYTYFIEKGVSLLKEKGLFSYIVANKWMRAKYGKPLRIWLKQQCLEEIIDFGDLPVFESAIAYPCVLLIKKSPPKKEFKAANIANLDFYDLNDEVKQQAFSIRQDSIEDNGWTLVNQTVQNLFLKLKRKGVSLGEYVNNEIYRGVLTGLNKAFIIDNTTYIRLIKEDAKSAEIIKPFLVGKDIKRYKTPVVEKYLIFTRRGIDITQYPAIFNYLEGYKEELMPRPEDFKGDNWKGRKPGQYEWYEIQDVIAYYLQFDNPKIIIPSIIKKASYSFDCNAIYSNDKTSIIASDSLYLLGILNSKVADFFIHSIASTKQGGFFEYKPMYISQTPIRTIEFSNPEEKGMHDQMVTLVNRMLDLNKKLPEATVPQVKTTIQRQIEATDKQIDQLVYKLYDLTDEEIKIVEGE